MKLTWLGHAACHIDAVGQSILIDPFLTGNPTYPEGWEDSLERCDTIVLTHGHDDHVGDTVRLAKKFNSTIFAQPEICGWLGSQGLSKHQPINIGGCVEQDGVTYCMVQAFHSSSTANDGVPVYLGDPAGIVIQAGQSSLYHAGDTGLFSDMQLIDRLFKPKAALLPVGDRFTMGPKSAAIACNEFLNAETIVPIHWGTFDLLHGDPEDFKQRVTRGNVVIMKPGGSIEV